MIKEEQQTIDSVVSEIRDIKPDEIKKINNTFSIYQQKLSLLSSYFSKEMVGNKDEIVNEMQEFLSFIKKHYIEHWCMVEKQEKVINHLEQSIIDIGGNLEDIRKKYNEQNKNK